MCARASEEAYLDAGLREWSGDQRTGISLGTAMGEVEELEILAGENSLKNGASHVAARRRAVPHQDLTERLAVRLGLRGPCSTFSMTCASGLGALEQSVCDLRLRRAEAMLLGGADTLSRFMQAGFCSLKALSPTGQVQPFQKGHDGIVLGEGAAFVLLEELEPARRRGGQCLRCGGGEPSFKRCHPSHVA